LPEINAMWNKYKSLAGINFLKLVSILPWWLLYLLSDFLFLLVYHIIRYRRNVVASNLIKSFPDKKPEELRIIGRRFYRHLCDLTLEALKTARMGGDELSSRMKILNPGLVNQYFEAGRSVTVMAVHYGNWEWLLHMPLHLRHHQYFVYKPLQNEWFDRYLNGLRSRFGGETISMSIALRKIIEADRDQIPVMTWLAADQTPPWFHNFWTIFLHQEAQFFDGPAKIARRFNQPVLFQQIRKVRRGFYETWFEVLVEDPGSKSEEEIVLAYVERVERLIREEPAWYIWSHRRWKHSRPSQVPLRLTKGFPSS
jgi:Kdo2-lipid IVA lauroyltransferase/acyltransferase